MRWPSRSSFLTLRWSRVASTTAPRTATSPNASSVSTPRRAPPRPSSPRRTGGPSKKGSSPPPRPSAPASTATSRACAGRTRRCAPRRRPRTAARPARSSYGEQRMTLVDQLARDAIRGDLGATLIVEAAAGTGKTTELVHRMIGAPPQRARRRLDAARRGHLHREGRRRDEAPPAHRDREGARETRARRTPSAAASTARSRSSRSRTSAPSTRFCADLLRERPVEARVDPLFEVMPRGREPSALFDEAFDALVPEALSAIRPRACAASCAGKPRDRDCARARARRCASAGVTLVEPARLRRALAARPASTARRRSTR